MEWLSLDALLNLCLNAIFHLRFVAINSEFGSSVCRLIFEIHLSIEKLDLTCDWTLHLPSPNSLPQSIANLFCFSQISFVSILCVCALLHLVSRTTGNFTPHDEHCCNFAAKHHLILFLSLHETKKRFFFSFTHEKQSRTSFQSNGNHGVEFKLYVEIRRNKVIIIVCAVCACLKTSL